MIGPLSLVLELLINRAIRRFRAGLAKDAILLGRELFFPLGVGFDNLASGVCGDFRAGFHRCFIFILAVTCGKSEGEKQKAN